MAWASYMLTQSLPYWPINPSITTDSWFNFQLDLVRCMWVVLPGAILWGASFPLALASVAVARAGSGAAGRRRLRREHRRRDRRLAVRQPAAGHVARQPARAAGADRRCRRSSGLLDAARPAAPRSRPGTFAVRRHRHDHRRRGDCRAARAQRPADARHARRLRPLCRDAGRAGRGDLHGRGVERVGRRDAAGERRPQLSQRRQGAGLERAAGHAAAADARPPHDADSASKPKNVLVIGCGAGVTAGAVSHRSGRRARRRSPRSSRSCRRSSPRISASTTSTSSTTQGAHPHRRRAALPADDRREVRRDHVGPARPVGQGRGDALHARSSSSWSKRTSIPAASSRCSCSCTRATPRR